MDVQFCQKVFLHLLRWSSVVQSLTRAQLFVTPMDWSTRGFPVLHHLPELAQTHVHWVSDAIQLSHLLLCPSLPAFDLSQHQGLLQWVSSLNQVAKVLELWILSPHHFSASSSAISPFPPISAESTGQGNYPQPTLFPYYGTFGIRLSLLIMPSFSFSSHSGFKCLKHHLVRGVSLGHPI